MSAHYFLKSEVREGKSESYGKGRSVIKRGINLYDKTKNAARSLLVEAVVDIMVMKPPLEAVLVFDRDKWGRIEGVL